jgi:hypothetical protein
MVHMSYAFDSLIHLTLELPQGEKEIPEVQRSAPHSDADTDHNDQGKRRAYTMDLYGDVDVKALKHTLENWTTTNQTCATNFFGKTSEVQWLHTATLAEMNRANEETRRSGVQISG